MSDTTTTATDTTAEYPAELATNVSEWKQKYGVLYEVRYKGAVAIFRKPKLADFEKAYTAARDKKAKALDFSRSIMRSCRLHLDPLFELGSSSDEHQFAMLNAMDDLADIPQAEVKKL